MKSLSTVLLLFLLLYSGHSQSIDFVYGEIFYKSKLTTGGQDVVSIPSENNERIAKVRVLYQPLPDRGHVFSSSFTSYRLVSDIAIGTEEERRQNLGVGSGDGRTRSYLLGIGYGYEFGKSRYRFNPQLVCNIEYSQQTWPNGFSGSSSKGRYFADFYGFSNPGWQVVPEILLRNTYRLFWGVNAIVEMSYQRGWRPTMQIDAEYYIDGIFAERASSVVNSTGVNVLFGLSYDFGWKKDRD